jgi:hypothetical protein
MIDEDFAANINGPLSDRRRRRLKLIKLAGLIYAALIIAPLFMKLSHWV